MKRIQSIALAALALATCLQTARAQLTIPSDGTDLDFAPTVNTVVDLGEAADGAWNAPNTAKPTKGIYDAGKWAVVFKYSSVNIPAGVKVTFKNHRSRAPVVWLVQGEVVINGELNLDGATSEGGVAGLTPSEPGPGGFRGGVVGPQGNGAGLGPVGGSIDPGAGHAFYDRTYGNPQILPLIGGSGSTGYGASGAGGGAILIATSGKVSVGGKVSAKGGVSNYAGSGGAVRIIASQVEGSGEVSCPSSIGDAYGGNAGRIRIETSSLSPSLRTNPETIGIPPAVPPIIWPPEAAPKVRIVSVDTFAAPDDPSAPLTSSADVAIQNDKGTAVVLETTNFPIEGSVQVRVAQKWSPRVNLVNAAYVSGNQAQATWRADITFLKGYTTLQARATAP